MKLYYAPGACSLAPHIVAREAGLPIELEKVDLGAKKTASGGDYRAVNPKGYVPALQTDEGPVLTEAAVVIQYLADRGNDLLPRSGIERYKALEWLTFISSEVHKGYGPLWNPKASEEMKQAVKDKLKQRLEFLDRELGSREYVTGSRFAAPDAYLFVILNWSGMTGVDLSPYPNLQAFQKRVGARPKVQEALRAEGLAK